MNSSGDRQMADIKRPGERVHDAAPKVKSARSADRFRKYAIIGALFLVLIIASAIAALNIRKGALNIYDEFKELVNNIGDFGGPGFDNSLNSIESDLGALDEQARFLSLAPKLREVPGAIGDLKEVISIIASLGKNFNVLQSEGLSLAFSGRGEELLTALKLMRFDLGRLNELSERLSARANELGIYEENVTMMGSKLEGVNGSLNALINFLDVDKERRVILLFENHSELRPSGGFAGSYGELVLERGNIKSLEVNDIYYPDKFITQKIIPPIQLQGITPNWGARDTNWFFDFSESSEKLLSYLEASSIYQDQNIKFDGVIALNVRVIEDILRLTGPLDLADYGLTLDANNFLREIQKEVETDKKPGENPKLVLKSAAPALIDALGKLGGNNQGGLLDIFVNRAKNKDIKFYFRDDGLESLAADRIMGGQEYELEAGFVGDYLAVVNANVAGGKTDVFVDQRVQLESQITPDGIIHNNLTISRAHRGGKEPEDFYNKINQNFLRIFTLPDTNLESIQGGAKKEIIPLVSYAGGDYVKDKDLSELEDSRTLLTAPADGYAEQYTYEGKRIFGTWFNVPPAESRALLMKYAGGQVPLVDGQKYKFVLDKQSGSEMLFEYTVIAPEGFEWRESQSSAFRYQEKALPARIEIELTLEQ